MSRVSCLAGMRVLLDFLGEGRPIRTLRRGWSRGGGSYPVEAGATGRNVTNLGFSSDSSCGAAI